MEAAKTPSSILLHVAADPFIIHTLIYNPKTTQVSKEDAALPDYLLLQPSILFGYHRSVVERPRGHQDETVPSLPCT